MSNTVEPACSGNRDANERQRAATALQRTLARANPLDLRLDRRVELPCRQDTEHDKY
jgi:hypothetical protein